MKPLALRIVLLAGGFKYGVCGTCRSEWDEAMDAYAKDLWPRFKRNKRGKAQ